MEKVPISPIDETETQKSSENEENTLKSHNKRALIFIATVAVLIVIKFYYNNGLSTTLSPYDFTRLTPYKITLYNASKTVNMAVIYPDEIERTPRNLIITINDFIQRYQYLQPSYRHDHHFLESANNLKADFQDIEQAVYQIYYEAKNSENCTSDFQHEIYIDEGKVYETLVEKFDGISDVESLELLRNSFMEFKSLKNRFVFSSTLLMALRFHKRNKMNFLEATAGLLKSPLIDILSTYKQSEVLPLETYVNDYKVQSCPGQLTCTWNIPVITQKATIYNLPLMFDLNEVLDTCITLEEGSYACSEEFLPYFNANSVRQSIFNHPYFTRNKMYIGCGLLLVLICTLTWKIHHSINKARKEARDEDVMIEKVIVISTVSKY